LTRCLAPSLVADHVSDTFLPAGSPRSGSRWQGLNFELVRVLSFEATGSMCFVLSDIYRCNMMSGELSAQYCLSVRCSQHLVTVGNASAGSVYCLQGAGHHFCPGGYVAPAANAAAARRTSVDIILLYSQFVALRRLSHLTVCRLHGLVVGGGVALSLNTTIRGSACCATISFGNLSRGAVPGMLLSRTIGRTCGCARSLACYLTDGLLHASHSLTMGFCNHIRRHLSMFRDDICTEGWNACTL
jgi:hypothetical protein